MTSIYHINHAISLTSSQKDEMADELTKLHTSTFGVPRLFVQVRFRAVQTPSAFSPDPRLEDDAADHDTVYIGGRRQLSPTNSIEVNIALPSDFKQTRNGRGAGDAGESESQTKNSAQELLKSIVSLWDRVAPLPVSRFTRGANQTDGERGDFELHSCIVHGIRGSDSAGASPYFASYVAGIILPDLEENVKTWVERNSEKFQAALGNSKKRKQNFDAESTSANNASARKGDEGFDRDGWGTGLLQGLVADLGKDGRNPSSDFEDEETLKRRKEQRERDQQAERERKTRELEDMLGWGDAA
ncbi:uncharacterized protein K489DRAFT_247860 [Dissoconium aciculare CBS 342.82]|uniref:Tautomerase cis-CaaD-like domain-containing protein n=1 Tax=Dissoconium aciculare CBS 342.82 TaxID=1314786 RepID=A0A6J3M1P8_9PEZI|nr:uncharacterized protein K489DRAFT_247860 [Dissoconium aciculare CBS 342.82]KAF1821429.1 hypothetical protein K489DRAFT_247860 [Dissoconium aciculare CBS 342.82]